MIYKLIIGIVLIATIIYYFFCFLEIFGVIKFTDKNTTVKIPQMFIPFYYLLKKDNPVEEPEKPKDYPITVYPGIVNLNSLINQVSINIVDHSYHGWSVDLPAWMTLEHNVGNGSKTIIVTVKRNAGKAARCGEITVTDTKTGDIHTVTVNQDAKTDGHRQVTLTINPGLFKSDILNNFDLIWEVHAGQDGTAPIIFQGQLGYPCQSGSVYTWGENQWSENIPESEWGTRKTIHYELVAVDYNDNSNAFQVLTGTADVEIPANPDGVMTVSFKLPDIS